MATEAYNRRLNRMTLTALRQYAKSMYSLKGLSKATKGEVIARINEARQAKPMTIEQRIAVYTRDRKEPTVRQRRQIKRMDRRMIDLHSGTDVGSVNVVIN